MSNKSSIHNKVDLKQMLRSTTCVSAAALFTFMQVHQAVALPQGAQVQHGDVQFNQAGNTLNINQGSNKAVINWQSFDIGANEATHFNQPSANAIALNRITGSQQPSQIFGALTATGKIILINPNGVVFGKGSQVDVGGLIASTANIKNQDFINDSFTFTEAGDPTGKIINFGEINAQEGGLVALIAPGVENHGVIRAKEGTVLLAGAETATLDLFGDGLINFALDGKSTGVDNQGVIQAEAGTVYMSAKAARGVVDNLINTDGVVQASSAYKEGGAIVLGGGSGKVRVAGKVEAKGVKGGSIEITGDVIALKGADIDSSGLNAGGKIRIGGDKRGEDKLQMATLTTVDNVSSIRANATRSGKGGDIALWSTGATDFEGHVEARGVSEGGFVEVSSTGELGFTGSADLSAENGNNGTLLLDPDHVIIGTRATQDAELADERILKADGSGSFYISALSVVNALNVSNVVIEALRTIAVNETIDASAGRNGSSLTLDAGTITLNKSIMLRNGNLDLRGNTISMNANVDLGNGEFQFASQGNASPTVNSLLVNTNATLKGSSFKGTFNTFNLKGKLDLSNDYITTVNNRLIGNGDITAADRLEVKGNSEVVLGAVNGKTVNIDARRITLNKAALATGGLMKLDGADFVTLKNNVSVEKGALDIDTAKGSVSITGAVDVRDNVNIDAKKNITLNSTLDANGDATLNAQNATLRGVSTIRDLNVTATRNISISGDVNASDDVRFDVGGTLTASKDITAADELTFDGNVVRVQNATGKTIDVNVNRFTAYQDLSAPAVHSR